MEEKEIIRGFINPPKGYQLRYSKIRKVKDPVRGTPGSAGIDIFSPEDWSSETIRPNGQVLIPSGLKFDIPDGMALIAFNKSGVAVKRGLLAGACVIDSDYEGEVHINLFNNSKKYVTIGPNEKLIQLLLVPVFHVPLVEVVESELFTKESERGEGGFGSTGE